MALTCGRFLRFLRSIFAPAATVIGFGLLLTWIFVLYQPIHGPGEQQRLGWQAWEPVSAPKIAVGTGSNTEDTGSVPASQPGNDNDVDWWNVTTQTSEPDTSSLPLDVWSPLLNHVTGCKLPFCSRANATDLTVCSDRNHRREMRVSASVGISMLSKIFSRGRCD